MAPFLVLSIVFGVSLGLGRLGVASLSEWSVALRVALAAMFLLTASAHWGKRRHDLIRMVPPRFRAPGSWVTLTGVLEVAGAAALLIEPLTPFAAAGLFLLLLAVFPANVHAARQRLSIGGRRVMPLLPRAALQLLFLLATAAVALHG